MKISVDSVKLYLKFEGDIDGYIRFGDDTASDDDWSAIDNMIQRLGIIKNGVAADSFIAGTNAQLASLFTEEAQSLIQETK